MNAIGWHIPESSRDAVLVLARGALGDVLVTLPFLAALPGYFGARALNLIGNPSTLSLLEAYPPVRGVGDQNQAFWSGLYQYPPFMEERAAAWVRSHSAAVVFARTGADPAARGLAGLGVSPVLVAPSRPPAGVHLADHLFAATGITPPANPPALPPPGPGLAEARSLLREWGWPEKGFAVLHPGSGGAGKNWPLPNWLELARRIEGDTNLPVLFPLGPAETGMAGVVAAARPHARPPVSLALPVLAGMISLAAVHVGHDSGVTHLAAALGCPTTALFGPTDPRQWSPRGARVRVAAPVSGWDPARGWEGLEMETVWHAVMGLLIPT